MKPRWIKRALGSRPVGRWTAKQGRGRVIVLCYHDLRETSDFASWLRVDARMFARHLEALASVGRFVGPDVFESGRDLVDGHLNFLLTFDDGYPNNLRLGADILENASAPAVFFVSTHHLVTQTPFWFDRVVTRIQAARLTRLDLSRSGLRDYRFVRDDGAERWDGIELLLSDLKQMGNPDHPVVAQTLDFLDAEYGRLAEPYEQWFRPINPAELKQLATRRNMFIGSHAHRHEILTYLPSDAVKASLQKSKAILEHMAETKVVDIAYPNGDTNADVVDQCVRTGYQRGFVATRGIVPKSPDLLRIPRILVGGFDTPLDLMAQVNLALLRDTARQTRH